MGDDHKPGGRRTGSETSQSIVYSVGESPLA